MNLILKTSTAILGLVVLIHARCAQAQDTSFTARPGTILVTDTLNKAGIPPPAVTPPAADSERENGPDSLTLLHDPRRAALYSAVLPGLGQAYNHKYWKIPIAYAGLGTATGFFVFNYKQFLIYRDANRLSYAGQTSSNAAINQALSLYSQPDLETIRDGYRQYVDYSALAFIGVYFLDILDAIVDAHLYYFSVSNDISWHIAPCVHDNYAGMGLVLDLDHTTQHIHLPLHLLNR